MTWNIRFHVCTNISLPITLIGSESEMSKKWDPAGGEKKPKLSSIMNQAVFLLDESDLIKGLSEMSQLCPHANSTKLPISPFPNQLKFPRPTQNIMSVPLDAPPQAEEAHQTNRRAICCILKPGSYLQLFVVHLPTSIVCEILTLISMRGRRAERLMHSKGAPGRIKTEQSAQSCL